MKSTIAPPIQPCLLRNADLAIRATRLVVALVSALALGIHLARRVVTLFPSGLPLDLGLVYALGTLVLAACSGSAVGWLLTHPLRRLMRWRERRRAIEEVIHATQWGLPERVA